MATGKKVSLKSYVSLYNFSFKRYFVNCVINEMYVCIIALCSVIAVRRLVAERYVFVSSRRTKEKSG
jgi:hypothetical protein